MIRRSSCPGPAPFLRWCGIWPGHGLYRAVHGSTQADRFDDEPLPAERARRKYLSHPVALEPGYRAEQLHPERAFDAHSAMERLEAELVGRSGLAARKRPAPVAGNHQPFGWCR